MVLDELAVRSRRGGAHRGGVEFNTGCANTLHLRLFRPQTIERTTACGHGEKARQSSPFRIKSIGLVPELPQDVLHDFFGALAVAQDPKADRKDRPGMSIVDLLKCGGLRSAESVDEHGIRAEICLSPVCKSIRRIHRLDSQALRNLRPFRIHQNRAHFVHGHLFLLGDLIPVSSAR